MEPNEQPKPKKIEDTLPTLTDEELTERVPPLPELGLQAGYLQSLDIRAIHYRPDDLG